MDWIIVLPVYEAEIRRIVTILHRGLTEFHRDHYMEKSYMGRDLTFMRESLRVVDSVFQNETFGSTFGLTDKRVVLPSEFLVYPCIDDDYNDALWKTTVFVLRKIEHFVEFDSKLENLFKDTLRKSIQSTHEELKLAQSLKKNHNFAIGDVPAQDSPKNILNILNDDCIGAILRKLESLGDFANASEVCTRFRDVSKTTGFPFKTLCIGRYENNRLKSIYPPVSMNWLGDSAEMQQLYNLQHFLSRFGPKINSIEWVLKNNFIQASVLKSLCTMAEFCGQSLTNLKLFGHYEIASLSQFEMLERLEYYNGFLHDFGASKKLKYLKLSCLWKPKGWLFVIRPHWGCIKQSFSNLEEAHFEYFDFLLADDAFIEFQRLNPQLKRLTAIHCTSTTTKAFKDISIRLPNLESLHLEGFKVAIQDLNGLKKLKHLRIPSNNFDLAEINSLIALGLPIEELEITPSNVSMLCKISKLNSIKELSLNISNVPQNELNINNLLALNLNISGKVSLINLKAIIRNIKNVTRLKLRLEWIIIDSDAYNSVLALVRNRISVKMIIDRWSGRIDVPKDILKANRAWLHVLTE